MNVSVNVWAVVLAMVSSMVVGMIWYAKGVFGTTWQKMVGLKDSEMKQGSGKAIASTVVVSLITAYFLAHVIFLSNSFFHNSWLQDALSTGFWVWLGFVATRMITHDAFERRPIKLTVMNIAHEFVTIMVMALVIGLIKP